MSIIIIDCCCEKRALKVSKSHNCVTIQDTDMYDAYDVFNYMECILVIV